MKAVDIPQADSLSRREEIVQFGAVDVARLQRVMTLHPRYVGYHLHAARILNCSSRTEMSGLLPEPVSPVTNSGRLARRENHLSQSIEASGFESGRT